MAADSGVTPSDLRPPLLGKRYVVQRRIGRGGTASVYTAYDLRLRTWRAVKVMHTDCVGDEDLRERFVLEAAAMANIDHPNVVRVSDVVHDVQIPYIVMEWLEGGSVATWIKLNGAMSPDLALDVMLDVTSALAFVHAKGIVHRDVNPRNLLLDRTGACKLTDFGIARITAESVPLGDDLDRHLTEAGTVMGTEAYMAPEQRFDSAQVDARADIYAAGATLYTLLTGRIPPDLSIVGPTDNRVRDLPRHLAPLLLKACSDLPERRYEHASALRSALEHARTKFPAGTGRARLIPTTSPLPPQPPPQLELTDLTSVWDLLESGAITGRYEPGHGEGDTRRERGGGSVVRSTLMALALGSMFGGTVFLFCINVLLGITAQVVRSAEHATYRAESVYHRNLDRYGNAHPFAAGTDAQAAFVTFDRADGNARSAAAERLYRTITTGTAGDLERVTAARDAYLRAYARWQRAADGHVGRIAVAIGMADRPE